MSNDEAFALAQKIFDYVDGSVYDLPNDSYMTFTPEEAVENIALILQGKPLTHYVKWEGYNYYTVQPTTTK